MAAIGSVGVDGPVDLQVGVYPDLRAVLLRVQRGHRRLRMDGNLRFEHLPAARLDSERAGDMVARQLVAVPALVQIPPGLQFEFDGLDVLVDLSTLDDDLDRERVAGPDGVRLQQRVDLCSADSDRCEHVVEHRRTNTSRA